ncbi:hypothetical protein J6590_091956 [Homalodisca vitripennis]|nr:hypothetical protein J6590_091956 [Homalodisca vitripennis]
MALIHSCNCNVQHTFWGSTNINSRERSKDGREDIEDDSQPGCLSMSKTDKMLKKSVIWFGLASCDFYLFFKVKSALKGTIFEFVETVKEKSARVLNELPEDYF